MIKGSVGSSFIITLKGCNWRSLKRSTHWKNDSESKLCACVCVASHNSKWKWKRIGAHFIIKSVTLIISHARSRSASEITIHVIFSYLLVSQRTRSFPWITLMLVHFLWTDHLFRSLSSTLTHQILCFSLSYFGWLCLLNTALPHYHLLPLLAHLFLRTPAKL